MEKHTLEEKIKNELGNMFINKHNTLQSPRPLNDDNDLCCDTCQNTVNDDETYLIEIRPNMGWCQCTVCYKNNEYIKQELYFINKYSLITWAAFCNLFNEDHFFHDLDNDMWQRGKILYFFCILLDKIFGLGFHRSMILSFTFIRFEYTAQSSPEAWRTRSDGQLFDFIPNRLHP